MPLKTSTAVVPGTIVYTPAPATKPVARPEVKGQVAMHAIITGYKVAGMVAPAISNGPEAVVANLHKLAAEIAAKVEAYTFND